MGGRFLASAVVVACGQPAPAPAPPTPPPPVAAAVACDAEWRFALVGSLYTPVDDITADELAAAWRAGTIATTAETRAALGWHGGIALAAGGRPELAADRWAIVPADELVPAWRVITVDGKHPLEADASGPLTVRRCGAPNIDPARVTTIAMTGTSALTRFVARLMTRRGNTYPTRDVAPWLRGADFVHISHEVSIVADCDAETSVKGMLMCAPPAAIEALEASHAKIIELTGSHLADFGRRWIDHTLDLYAARGWVWFGGGRNQLEAAAPRIIEHHGNRVGFLGCNMPWTTSQYIVEGPGVAACDLERLASEIAELRRRGIVPIVSIQHEEVYTHEPPAPLVRDFRRIAEAGAAVVFGSQAHAAHPWEVHHGAFVHYGAGNFLFDQQFVRTRDAAHDKLYIHAGRLLAVGQLYTRLEEWGRPRPMTAGERTRFVAKLRAVQRALPAARPWAPPRTGDPRRRVDSFLVGKQLQRVIVTPPARLADGLRYPLVIDLVGDSVDDGAFVARVRTRSRRVAAAASTYLQARYAIDPAQITVRGLTARGRAGAPLPLPRAPRR